MSNKKHPHPFQNGLRDALGLPMVVLTGGMIGFGALAEASGFNIYEAVLATVLIWALPGQIVLADLHATGANTWTIVIAVSIANLRFLPMTIAVMPHLRGGVSKPSLQLVLAQMLSANSFLYILQAVPNYSAVGRVQYFTGFVVTCVLVAIAATVGGHITATQMAASVALGFLFVNIIFIACLLANNRAAPMVTSILIGAIAGPICHLISPSNGILIAGVVGGTAGHLLFRQTKGQSS